MQRLNSPHARAPRGSADIVGSNTSDSAVGVERFRTLDLTSIDTAHKRQPYNGLGAVGEMRAVGTVDRKNIIMIIDISRKGFMAPTDRW